MTFPPSVEARIAEALLARLRSDPLLAGWATQIRPYRIQDLMEGDTLVSPAVGVVIGASSESRVGSGRANEIRTIVVVAIVTSLSTASDEPWLTVDVADHIKRLVAEDSGVIKDPEGRRLTEALLAFERLGAPLRVGAGGNLLIDRVGFAFRSNIHEATREILE